MDSTKLKAKLKLSTEYSHFIDKYLSYKPAYLILNEVVKPYGPLTCIQFGINHTSKSLMHFL